MFVSPMFVFVPAALFHCAIRNGRRAAWLRWFWRWPIAALLRRRGPRRRAADAAMSYGLGRIWPAGRWPSRCRRCWCCRSSSAARRSAACSCPLLVLAAIAGLAVTEIGHARAAGFSPYAAQVAQAQQTSRQFMACYQQGGHAGGRGPARCETVDRLQHVLLLPAFLLIDIAIVFVLSLVMFGRLQAWRELVGARGDAVRRAPYLFRNLSLPDWLLFAFVLGGLTPLASGMLQKVGGEHADRGGVSLLPAGAGDLPLAARGDGRRASSATLFGWLLLAS